MRYDQLLEWYSVMVMTKNRKKIYTKGELYEALLPYSRSLHRDLTNLPSAEFVSRSGLYYVIDLEYDYSPYDCYIITENGYERAMPKSMRSKDWRA